MKKGVVIAIAAAAMVAVAGGWWFGRGDGKHAAAASAVATKSNIAVVRDPVKRAEGIRAHMARHRQLWRTASYIEVRQLARNGDALAQRRLSEIYEDCLAYAGPLRGSLEMLRDLAKADPAIKSHISAIYNDRNRLCMQAAADLQRDMKIGEYWLHRSAKSGDQVAEMRYFSRSVPTLSHSQLLYFLEGVRANGHPDAIFEFSLLLARVDGSRPWTERTDVLTLSGPQAEQAWALVACRAGFDCTRGSRLMTMICVSLLSCDKPDYERYLRSSAAFAPKRAQVDALMGMVGKRLQPPAS